MHSRSIVYGGLAASLLLGAFTANAQQSDSKMPAWPELKKKIEAHWSTTYPTEKVLSVEPKGGVEYSSTERVTETDWWWTDVKEISGAFARQTALVTVERANRSRARFEVAALYRGADNKYRFDKIAVGPVAELGAPGAPALPSSKAASELFLAAWRKARPDFTPSAVTILGTPAMNQSGERRWINYKLAIDAVGTAKGPAKFSGKKVRCEPADYASALKWDAVSSSWIADEASIVNINEDSACSLAP